MSITYFPDLKVVSMGDVYQANIHRRFTAHQRGVSSIWSQESRHAVACLNFAWGASQSRWEIDP